MIIILITLQSRATFSQQTLSYIYNKTPYQEVTLENLYKSKKAQQDKLELAKATYKKDSLEIAKREVLQIDRQQINTVQSELDKTQKTIEDMGGQRVTFYGVAAITTGQDIITAASGSGKMAAFCNLGYNMGFALSYNKIGIKPASVSEDSLDVNSIMFPESGSSGLITTLNWAPTILNHGNNTILSKLMFSIEFALKQNSVKTTNSFETIDSTGTPILTSEISTLNFTSLNYHLGAGYLWSYIPDKKENTVQVGLGIYFHILNIPDEDESYFADIFNDTALIANNNSHIASFGSKLTFQYKGLSFFADVRQNYKKDLQPADPFAGTVFSIGTLVATEIFKL